MSGMYICICSIWIYHYICKYYTCIYFKYNIYIYVCAIVCIYHSWWYLHISSWSKNILLGRHKVKKTPDRGSCRCHRLRNIGLAAGRQRQLPVRMEHCIVPEHGRCCRQIRHLQHFVLVFFGGLVAQLLRNDLNIRQLSPLCEVPVCPNMVQYTGYVQKPSRILGPVIGDAEIGTHPTGSA